MVKKIQKKCLKSQKNNQKSTISMILHTFHNRLRPRKKLQTMTELTDIRTAIYAVHHGLNNQKSGYRVKREVDLQMFKDLLQKNMPELSNQQEKILRHYIQSYQNRQDLFSLIRERKEQVIVSKILKTLQIPYIFNRNKITENPKINDGNIKEKPPKFKIIQKQPKKVINRQSTRTIKPIQDIIKKQKDIGENVDEKCIGRVITRQTTKVTNQEAMRVARQASRTNKQQTMIKKEVIPENRVNQSSQSYKGIMTRRTKQNKKHEEVLKCEQIVEKKVMRNCELKVDTPLCPKCKCTLDDKKCWKACHFIVFCPKCEWHDHNCIKEKQKEFYAQNQTAQLLEFDQLIINCLGKPINIRLKSIPFANSKNNILEYIYNDGYTPIQHFKYLPSTPNFSCKYPRVDPLTAKSIIQNRDNQEMLPLQIKKSDIPEAGLGVFATKQIDGNQIVCSYLGEVGLISMIPSHRNVYEFGSKTEQMKMNDSIFTLGWIDKEALLVVPNRYCNIGRYINYNQPSKCNLKASIAMMETPQKKVQPLIILVSTRRIRRGQQLYYQYGPEYSIKDLEDN